MAAKFTAGDSIATTRKTSAKSPPPAMHHKNTMNGMPAHIGTGMSARTGGAKGGKPMMMSKANSGLSAKTREIGNRGGSGAKSLNHPGKKATGTMAGKMESLKGRARSSSERGGSRKSTMY